MGALIEERLEDIKNEGRKTAEAQGNSLRRANGGESIKLVLEKRSGSEHESWALRGHSSAR